VNDNGVTVQHIWGHNIIGQPHPISPEIRRRMLTEVVYILPSLTEATIGIIPRPIAATLQKTL
jgi:hypothetical protein